MGDGVFWPRDPGQPRLVRGRHTAQLSSKLGAKLKHSDTIKVLAMSNVSSHNDCARKRVGLMTLRPVSHFSPSRHKTRVHWTSGCEQMVPAQ